MPLMRWEEKFSVGIEELDRQHESLIDLINRCHNLIKADKLDKEIKNVISQLHKYSEEHFALEEDYMRRAGYKQLQGHINQHWQFTKTVMDLEEQFDIEGKLKSEDIMYFLLDWLVDHILISDRQYTEALKNSGIT